MTLLTDPKMPSEVDVVTVVNYVDACRHSDGEIPVRFAHHVLAELCGCPTTIAKRALRRVARTGKIHKTTSGNYSVGK